MRVVAGCGKDAGIWGQDTRVSFLALPLNSRVTGTRRIPLWVSPPGSPNSPVPPKLPVPGSALGEADTSDETCLHQAPATQPD